MERYDTRKTLMSLEKLPVIVNNTNPNNYDQVKKLLFKEAFAYMKQANLCKDCQTGLIPY